MSVKVEKEEKKKVAPKKKKEKAAPEPYWQEMVDVYFDFCKGKFGGEEPTFDGSAPRDLKAILVALRGRAEKKGVIWDLESARIRFLKFLDVSYTDTWLSQNFVLFNINRQKDKIFFKIANQNTNGTANQTYWQRIGFNGVKNSEIEQPL